MTHYGAFILVFHMIFSSSKCYSSKCKDPSPMENFNITKCVGVWYQIAGGTKCENCCVTHRLQEVSPGVVNLTISIKKPSEDVKVTKCTLRQHPNAKSVVYFGEDPNPYTIVDVIYDDYAVLYRSYQNELLVFSRKSNTKLESVVSKKGVKKCDMKTYQYNPDVSCN